MSGIVLVVAGILFALGLGISGMTDAGKVIAFLDLSGGWDPSLGVVMAGAIGVHLPFVRWIRRDPTRKPWFADSFHLPTRRDVTPRLVLGATLFGAGWGLSGYCPGPALVSAATGGREALGFVVAMSGGMALFHLYEHWQRRRGA